MNLRELDKNIMDLYDSGKKDISWEIPSLFYDKIAKELQVFSQKTYTGSFPSEMNIRGARILRGD